MKNLDSFMKQAREMQDKMERMQVDLESAEVTGSAGGDMVTAIVNGKGQVRGLKIDPSLFESGDREMLEDLVVAAVNDALRKVEANKDEQMKNLTGGLSLPGGMKLPF